MTTSDSFAFGSWVFLVTLIDFWRKDASVHQIIASFQTALDQLTGVAESVIFRLW